MNLNRVELIGGIVRPPDLKYTPRGYPHASMTLAVEDTRYSREEGGSVATTSFIGCQAWGKMAEKMAEEEMRKGEKVYVLGQLDQSEYEDRDGNKVSKTRVRVSFYVRLEPSDEGWSGGEDMSEPEEAPF